MSSDPKPALWLRCETKPFEHRSVGLSRYHRLLAQPKN